MSFDGTFINYIVRELSEEINNARISKIYQLSGNELLFKLRTNKTMDLIISIAPKYQRVHITNNKYDRPKTPYNFCMFLRKHLEGGIIENISQHENDRLIQFSISSTNELKDKVSLKLIIEVMGKNSNVILVDESNKILDSIKRTPLDAPRDIRPNLIYEYPENFGKINPFNVDNFNFDDIKYDKSKFILDNFQGISPLLAKEISIKNDLSIIKNEIKPSLLKQKNKENFYLFELTHLNAEIINFNSLSELLDNFYYQKDTMDRIKQQAKDLSLFVKRQIIKNTNKLKNLKKDLAISDDANKFRTMGELILSNMHKVNKGCKDIEVLNYYTNEIIKIDLDVRVNATINSQKYFKKYKKLKNSVLHIEKQIEITENEIKYFNLLSDQMNHIDLHGIQEIRLELETQKYLKKKIMKNKTKKNKPLIECITTISGDRIYIGKNNIQNEYLTHKFADRFDTWFHVKDTSGSHVVVSGDNLSEDTIRTAANLAAYYSKAQNSQSVAVDYTLIKNIKKIPGMRNCFVTYSNQKTIYIDPNKEFIMNLMKK